MKNVKIYQLPVEHKAKFMGWEFVTENNITPKLEDYKVVWEGLFSSDSDLDYIYTKFNVGKKPNGFTGHSLSVSDIVEIDGKYFYCDDYGWKEITFTAEKPKKKYIVKAYGSSNYKSIYDTREEALEEANKLNDDYYQRKIWNVEEIIDEDAKNDADFEAKKAVLDADPTAFAVYNILFDLAETEIRTPKTGVQRLTVKEIAEKMREKMPEILLPKNLKVDVAIALSNLIKVGLVTVEQVVRANSFYCRTHITQGYALAI